MLIHLVRKDYGAKVANQVASGQAQFVSRPVPRDERSRLARLQDWLRANLNKEITIESMSARASMSPRTLQREFKAATGESPHAWLLRERIEHAKELLESPAIPMRRIVERAGIGSEESLRHHFRKLVGTTPSAYRARFGSRDVDRRVNSS